MFIVKYFYKPVDPAQLVLRHARRPIKYVIVGKYQYIVDWFDFADP